MHLSVVYTAVIVTVAVLMANAQDFGFPEETGLGKEKQNADVSDSSLFIVTTNSHS